MKARIVEIKEEGDQLRVIVQHEYGVDNLGISKKKEEHDHITGQPKWLIDVKKLLEKKYKNAKKPDKTDYVGKDLEIEI